MHVSRVLIAASDVLIITSLVGRLLGFMGQAALPSVVLAAGAEGLSRRLAIAIGENSGLRVQNAGIAAHFPPNPDVRYTAC